MFAFRELYDFYQMSFREKKTISIYLFLLSQMLCLLSHCVQFWKESFREHVGLRRKFEEICNEMHLREVIELKVFLVPKN